MNHSNSARFFASVIVAGVLGVLPAASQDLTKEECQQANRLAIDVYEMARNNTKEYPTDNDAKEAARKAYLRRINGELSSEPGHKDLDINEAIERCRKLDANGTKKAEAVLV